MWTLRNIPTKTLALVLKLCLLKNKPVFFFLCVLISASFFLHLAHFYCIVGASSGEDVQGKTFLTEDQRAFVLSELESGLTHS